MRTRDRPRDLVIILLMVSFGIAGLNAWGTVLPMWRAHAAAGWTETTCTLDVVSWVSRRHKHRPPHEDLAVAYTYAAGGQTYTGHDVDFTVRADASHMDGLRDAERGDVLPCWYDPDDPARAVLQRVGWEDGAGEWAIFVVAFGLMTLFALLARGDDPPWRPIAALAPRALIALELAVIAWCAPDAGAPDAARWTATAGAVIATLWIADGVRRVVAARRPSLPRARLT